MKLQTWITWLCCMAVLIATIIVDVLVWNVERKNIISEATSNALNEMYSLADAYNQTFERSQFTSNSDEVMDIQLQYFFKTRLDEYTICVRYQEIDGTLVNDAEHGYFVYNHTVLSLDDVENNDYNSIANETISYGTLHYQDSEYLICKYTTKNRLSIYHLTCIDYAKDKLRNLTMYMIVITFSVMVVMSIIVALILRHSLRSLKELNATAADIAKGNYDKRVNVRGKNEIATLGTTFNQMAEAVETRTKSLEESERQKTLFMGNLTHELKTPLAASRTNFRPLSLIKWYNVKQSRNSRTNSREMNDITFSSYSYLALFLMVWQRSPTFFSFTISRNEKRTPNLFSISVISTILVSESHPSTSWAVVLSVNVMSSLFNTFLNIPFSISNNSVVSIYLIVYLLSDVL